MKCLILISIPGNIGLLSKNKLILKLKKQLLDNNIQSQIVDTVIGWGNLTQEWLEFECDMDISYGWVEFSIFDLPTRNYYNRLFQLGKLIMMIFYIENDGRLIPHNSKK